MWLFARILCNVFFFAGLTTFITWNLWFLIKLTNHGSSVIVGRPRVVISWWFPSAAHSALQWWNVSLNYDWHLELRRMCQNYVSTWSFFRSFVSTQKTWTIELFCAFVSVCDYTRPITLFFESAPMLLTVAKKFMSIRAHPSKTERLGVGNTSFIIFNMTTTKVGRRNTLHFFQMPL